MGIKLRCVTGNVSLSFCIIYVFSLYFLYRLHGDVSGSFIIMHYRIERSQVYTMDISINRYHTKGRSVHYMHLRTSLGTLVTRHGRDKAKSLDTPVASRLRGYGGRG